VGWPFEEASRWIERVIHSSLEAPDKMIQEKKVAGGPIAGVRVGVFIVDVKQQLLSELKGIDELLWKRAWGYDICRLRLALGHPM
jgi:hypothetical protein